MAVACRPLVVAGVGGVEMAARGAGQDRLAAGGARGASAVLVDVEACVPGDRPLRSVSNTKASRL